MGPMPLCPFLMACQTGSVPIPTEVSIPTPVTTTLRCKGTPRNSYPATSFRLDVGDRVLHSCNLLGILVWDIEIERFLEGHNQLYDIQRIGAEVIDETGGG